MTYQLHHGNMLDILPMMDRESIDSIVTDPPYGLSFMGKDWDHGVPGEHFWRECYRVAKPGAYLLAFGGTRTFHRLACAIEDAGWEIRDDVALLASMDDKQRAFFDSLTPNQQQVFLDTFASNKMLIWVYGQGFPKSHDVSKAIDKRGGVPVAWFGPWFREWRESKGITQKEVAALFPSKTGGLTGCVANWELGFNMPTPEQFNLIRDTFNLPFDSIDEAEREVIGQRSGNLLAVAPGQNNDRSKTTLDITSPATPLAAEWSGWGTALKPAWEPIIVARKPLQGTVAENVTRYGTGAMNIDGCRIETAQDDPNHRSALTENLYRNNFGGGIDTREPRQHGTPQGRWPANLIHDGSAEVLAGFPMTTSTSGGNRGKSQIWGNVNGDQLRNGFDDTGSAARFFYCAKASKQDRDEGCEGLEEVRRGAMDGNIDDGDFLTGSGNPRKPIGYNHHPTVKPTSLMRYLCRLVTPPNGVVLDPFMGSGSTGKAAILEGFNFIGVDTEIEYVEIAARRIEHACERVGIVVDQPMLFDTKRETVDRPKQLILL